MYSFLFVFTFDAVGSDAISATRTGENEFAESMYITVLFFFTVFNDASMQSYIEKGKLVMRGESEEEWTCVFPEERCPASSVISPPHNPPSSILSILKHQIIKLDTIIKKREWADNKLCTASRYNSCIVHVIPVEAISSYWCSCV